MEIGAFIQARMGSERLPGKVLRLIRGKELLLYLVERLYRCPSLNKIVIATSDEEIDRPIVEFCEKRGISFFVGSLRNVAQRFRDLIETHPVDAFVRISGDSPLIDQALVSLAVDVFCHSSYDFVTNVQKRTFPKGQSVEVIRSRTYCTHFPFFADEYDREHVTPYFYRNRDIINIYNLESGKDWGSVQLSVDRPEDFLLIQRMIDLMDKPHWEYDLEGLMKLRGRALKLDEASKRAC